MTSQDLAALLSDCSVSLRVAAAPLVDAAPPSTTADNLHDAEQSSSVCEWATRLLDEPGRHELYRGEAVRFYVVAEVPQLADSPQNATLNALLLAKQDAKLFVTASCATGSNPLPVPGRMPRRESLGLGIAGQSSFSTMAASHAAASSPSRTHGVAGETDCKEVGFWVMETAEKRTAIWQFSTQLDFLSASTASISAQLSFSGGASIDKSASANAQSAIVADDYMDDGDFDSVDLLGTLSASSSHKAETRPEARGASAAAEQADETAPTFRRDAQITLPLASPLSFDLRVIPSPTGEGALLAVEVFSAGEQRCDLLDIDARSSDRLSTGVKTQRLAFDVRPYRSAGGHALPMPSFERPAILSGPNSRHVHLFSVTLSPFTPDRGSDTTSDGALRDDGSPAVPLDVMTSPSQRFTSRFVDRDVSANDSARRARASSVDDAAKLGVTVKASARIYDGESKLPTSGLVKSESRCDFDSSLLRPRGSTPVLPIMRSDDGPCAPVSRQHAETRRDLPLSPHALAIAALSARIASSATSKSSNSQTLPSHQTFAGAERYTRKALAAIRLSEPSVALDRPALYPVDGSDAAILPRPRKDSTSSSALSSAPKRFFSLPQSSTPMTSMPAASASSANILPIRTETPPPIVVAKRASVPDSVSSDAVPVRPQAAHRKSWISGLRRPTPSDPIEAAGISASASLPRPPTSWDTVDTVSAPPTETTIESFRPREDGKVIVSVSLVPLRKPRRRKSPPTLQLSTKSLVPAAESSIAPSSLSPLPPHRTTFAFPPASPLSPSHPSPTDIPSIREGAVGAHSNSGTTVADRKAPAYEEITRTPRINVLDVFLVDVFVLNQTSRTKHYVVRAPEGCLPTTKAGSAAAIMALETDVEVGPLEPKSCAACALRFLAVRTGSHVLEQLRLVDLTNGTEMVLDRPVTVVVE